MKGCCVTTLFTVSFFVSVCFSQVSNTDRGVFGVRNNNPLDGHCSHISGVVVGSNGAPLPDVRVEVRSEQTGSAIASGYTNNSGAFEFDGLPLAAYEVVASQGLAESRERLALGDVGVNLKIRLNTRNSDAAQADGNATVSIAEYKVPQKARDASWQSYFEMAKSYVGKADYDHALQQLTKAQTLNATEYAPIHLVRAHVMLALKNYSSAMDELQAFLTLAPKDPNSSAARETLEKVKAFTTAAANPPMVTSAR